MRISILLLSFCFFLISSGAQAQRLLETKQQLEQYEKLRQPFLKILTEMQVSYPEQKHLQDLRVLVETNHTTEVLKLDESFYPLSYNTMHTVTRMVHNFLTEFEIPLPANFLSLSKCEQRSIVELLAITYQANFLHGVPGEKLPDDLLKMLIEFSDPTKLAEPDEEEQQKLIELINRFEKLAMANIDSFSTVLFNSCSSGEITILFGPDQSKNQQLWTGSMKVIVHDKLETAKAQLTQ